MMAVALIVYCVVGGLLGGWLGDKYLLRGDRKAVDRITVILDGNEWGPDTLAAIADEVRRTGRQVRDLDEYDLRLA
jgi:hypothetical protein